MSYLRSKLICFMCMFFVYSAWAGESYNMTTEFSSSNNPNGVWTYGNYTNGLDKSSFEPYVSKLTLEGNPNCNTPDNMFIDGWHANQLDPSILKNFGESDVYCLGFSGLTFRAGAVVFGPYLGPSVARFTVPSSGSWQIDAAFSTIQSGNHPPAAYIHTGGADTLVFDVVASVIPDYFTEGPVGYSQLVSGLATGDTIDVVVWGNNVHNKSTEVSATISKAVINADVDVKPGTEINSINLCSGGTVPVAILGSDIFDVYEVDTSTLKFADTGIKVVGKKDKQLCDYQDINSDGYEDLICHFVTMDISALDGSSVSALVTGSLWDSVEIEGSDSVNIVKDTCE